MSRTKAQKLLEVAGRSLDNGEREVAKQMVVLAMRQEDAIDALDKLLPQVAPDLPEFEVEEDSLSESQVAKILTLAAELEKRKKFKLVSQILSKVEMIEKRKRKGRKK